VFNPISNFREATQMAFFDDMGSAVRTYPDSNVTVTIIDFDPADNDALNERRSRCASPTTACSTWMP
jgi:hypothetical protein